MTALKIEKWEKESILHCFEALCDLPYTLFFDSNRSEHPLNRYSILCWNPAETITAKNATLHHNDKETKEKDVFSFLEKRLNNYKFDTAQNDLPFTAGMAGYFGYDLGRQIETIPTDTNDDRNLPDMMVGIYTNSLVWDRQENKTWLITESSDQQEFLEKRLSNVKKNTYAPSSLNWKTNKNDDTYRRDIQKAIDYIYAGDIYQVNLSRRFEAQKPENLSPSAHYQQLRRVNPAPFSAFMNLGSLQLSSSSPERFLSVKKRDIETRPIKGTLPSSQPKETLLNSKKDRAENTMIVDLLRNDLSKVCDHNSVTVPNLCKLETFEGLHHLVSTVTGTLQKNKTALDLLHACFPGGSITGAPKIRAMEIIEELEEHHRGPYCGAMGYIDFNGNMDTNIMIRTLIYTQDKIYLQTGSGIVSDSIPEQELQESLDKAAKIFESFETQDKESAA